jgi:putative ABC transport system substrate-binding protein
LPRRSASNSPYWKFGEARTSGLPSRGSRVAQKPFYVCPDPLLFTNRLRINTLALGGRVPTMHGVREFAEAAGLMSYGPSYPDLFRRAADYVDNSLRGAKPSDLPVERPTKYDLVVSLITRDSLD